VVDGSDWDDVQASLCGDGEAYARLVRRHQDDVAGYLRLFTRDRQVWEELTQEAFVQAYLSLRTFRGEAPLAHWLRKIATRVGYRHWKNQKRQQLRAQPLEEWEPAVEAADSDTDSAQAAALVHATLARLAPRDRLVLPLMYLEQRSVADTASLVGWSQTMVKVQAHRARKKLRQLLEQEMHKP
jgi:RNA polymerase sigma-70 factor, ECF subfamily